VVANLSPNAQTSYRLGFPDDGTWRLRFSSDEASYCPLFGGHPSTDVEAQFKPADAQPASAQVSIGPYSLLVFSQDRVGQPLARFVPTSLTNASMDASWRVP
jgi:1,4-alpha-glucan branching enzyme